MFFKLRAIEIHWNSAAEHLLLPHIKLFWKTKRGLELDFLIPFLHGFSRIIFLLLYCINWSNFIGITSWDIWQYACCNSLLTSLKRHEFKNLSYISNLRFLYGLKHKVRLSKTMCGIFYFLFRFVFIKVYVFVQKNAWILWLQNIIIPFKTESIEKPHRILLLDLWFWSCNKKFENSVISVRFGAPQKLTWWQSFSQ